MNGFEKTYAESGVIFPYSAGKTRNQLELRTVRLYGIVSKKREFVALCSL